ncbi:carboxymuconolactone decarboxylase family protein [Mycobacterium sp. MYCO198283]|uniref:carboxymuconolactone decarboxylase family protein n=1 Tax=Mycobacterium sp. MYCO198283 TaxID=2883505 RepID=UPI001E6049FE|nr:carboxymuconolactone decarboxylase family protein [Mycobacterium sp. MYCO198283]MCG5432788.1 carboxymuconolactone decarboxylase family protein [Mycobacterium sp. MYCO198283]
MSDGLDKGIQIFRELMPGVDVDLRDGLFADELLEIGFESVFGKLWSRDGLSRRDRSLVTLGILIAQRSAEELRSHFAIARTNGLTETELAEVIYHATGYAGFPAANTARAAAIEALEHHTPRA